jgi:hypothetical protein
VTRYRRATTVHLAPAVRDALEERAWAERKSVSKLAEILLASALGFGTAAESEPTRPQPVLDLARLDLVAHGKYAIRTCSGKRGLLRAVGELGAAPRRAAVRAD